MFVLFEWVVSGVRSIKDHRILFSFGVLQVAKSGEEMLKKMDVKTGYISPFM